ncbi:hypothetical protein GJAV_G00060880 [Gymnothorax javanicus]|nr:hypothetical protein GJAV_G00060880 [Gymnothorax javanicus]
MADVNKTVKLTGSKKKTIEYKQHSNTGFQPLARSQLLKGEKVDLRKLLTYQLTLVPCSIGLADDFLAKTDKSKGMQYLSRDMEDSDLPKPEECMIIEDGNAVFH